MSQSQKNISKTLVMPPGIRERFLHFGSGSGDDRYDKTLLTGGFSDHLPPGYEVRIGNCQTDEFYYVAAGELWFHDGGGFRRVAAGGFAFLPRGTLHAFHTGHGTAADIWFHYRSYLGKPARLLHLPERFLFHEARFGGEVKLLAELLYLQNHTVHAGRESTIDQLLGYLEEECLEPDAAPGVSLQRKLEAVFLAARQNFRKNWSVPELAAAAGLSVPVFHDKVRRLFHKTPQELLREFRLSVAAGLLKDTDLPLKTIAEETGYSGEFAFSKAFRQQYGVSPGRFRRGETVTK